MQIEVHKNELAGALNALGKLVCRTSPIEAYRSVQIIGKENKLHFRTAGTDETIEFVMDAELENEFSVIVGFELFRQAVRGCKNKVLVFELSDGHFAIGGIQITLANCEFPKALEVPADSAKSIQLPDSIVELLATAAPMVNRSDYRKVLQGINLSKDGITATNGKELFNVPLEMDVESLTIPFPLALIATKATGLSALNYWTNGVNVFFQITVGDWCWSGKALEGQYPNWKLVVPDRQSLTHSVAFSTESAELLKSWLKTVPDDPPNNGIGLSQEHGHLAVCSSTGMKTGIAVEFGDDWNDYKLYLNRDILLRLLGEGHTRLECQSGNGPFIATGGIGQYVAMPLYQTQPATKEEPKAEPVAAEAKTETTENNPNHNNEECKPMVVTNNPVVSAPVPVQTAAINTEPAVETNPLEELTASVESFKLKLKTIFEESNALSRKVKEVIIAQKQKERDFIQAKRAIERIRIASGF